MHTDIFLNKIIYPNPPSIKAFAVFFIVFSLFLRNNDENVRMNEGGSAAGRGPSYKRARGKSAEKRIDNYPAFLYGRRQMSGFCACPQFSFKRVGKMKRFVALCCSVLFLLLPFYALAGESEDFAETLTEEMSAFEITAAHRQAAPDNEKGYPVLDAGRGNPNWINTQARYAFIRMMEFGLSESERTLSVGTLAGQAKQEGIAERFEAFMDPADETDAFLLQAVDWCVEDLGIEREQLLKELTDALIGDYYPSPGRCLTCTEKILNAYIADVLFNGKELAGETEIFAVEGGTAAIVYIFNSLSHNRLLCPGDTIAIATPIFTPYLEIPDIEQYSLVSVDVASSEEADWDIPEEELDKLADPSVKAFFLVNPSNPAARALSGKTLDKLEEVLQKNPDLIIITDDVYATFTEGFESVYARAPYNTILVYSFSKLYGVTGWRLGVIAMHEENVCDRLLSQLSEAEKESLQRDYSSVMPDISGFKMIDRMVADSRSIGLYHTAGLNTPSQAFMDMLAMTHLLYEEDAYIQKANSLVGERYEVLMEALGLPCDESFENSRYYTLIDVQALMSARYGSDFADWMSENVGDLEFLTRLAVKEGVVLMYGPGFGAPAGNVRVSLANLEKESYAEIARRLFELMDDCYAEYASLTVAAAA